MNPSLVDVAFPWIAYYIRNLCVGFFFSSQFTHPFFALILLRFSHICRTWSVFWNFISAPHSNTKAPIHSQFLLFLCMCWHVCVFFLWCCCCWALSACTSSFRSIERFKPKLQLQSVLSVWHGAHFGTHQLQIVSELLQWKWIQTICYARKMIQQILKVEQRQNRPLANRNCKWIELKSGIFFVVLHCIFFSFSGCAVVCNIVWEVKNMYFNLICWHFLLAHLCCLSSHIIQDHKHEARKQKGVSGLAMTTTKYGTQSSPEEISCTYR